MELPGQSAGAFQFVVVQDGVERDEDIGAVAMGKIAQASDFGDIVAGAVTGTERRAADIDGIGAVLDRFDAEIGVLGRGEEF